MNSHDRRVTERRWPHCVYLHEGDGFVEDCFEWLHKNFGSCRWVGRNNPRWCWRPDMGQGPGFTIMRHGVEVFFRKKEDYAWFMLKWEQ